MSRPQGARSAREIFLAPTVLAVISTAGLVFALVVEGAGDALAWIGIGAPVAVIVWAWMKRRTWPANGERRPRPPRG